MTRELLPNRRYGETIETVHVWMPATDREIRERMLVTVGRYPDGRVGEVFINYENHLNERAINLGRDIATILSIALQYGAPLDVLAAAVSRSEINLMGKAVVVPHTPIGTVLDLLMAESQPKSIPAFLGSRAQPSQPSPASQAPAATTPATPPADVQVEELPLGSSTENSQTVDHFALDTADLDPSRVHLANCIECRARIYEGDGHQVRQPNDEFYCSACANAGSTAPASPETAPSDEAPMVSAAGESPVIASAQGVNEPQVTVADGANTGGDDEVASIENALNTQEGRPDEDGQRADADGLGSDVESVAPHSQAQSKKDQVLECHLEHPDWPAKQIAAHLELSLGSVRGHVSALQINLPSQRAYDEALARGEASAKAAKRAAQPVPPIGKVMTLKDRVRAVHLQHSTWTPAMIAKELGVRVDSVLPVLTRLRNAAVTKAAPQQEFAGRNDMVKHYAAVGKRLGRR